jgi:hypothetical protein|tara:strand:- start:367 stop:960 length:594 start_codon:yes stop_codon:yes gene_type:complete
MSRSIGSAFGTQLTSGSLRPFYAIKMNFTSGALLLATTYADLIIGGNTYFGSGHIISISPIVETSDTRASGIEIKLNGLDTSILSAGLTEDTQGMVVEVYFGVLTTTNNADAIVDTPYQVFSGFIDAMILTDGGETSTLTFTVENKLITLERPTDRRYTDQDQQNLFTGDKGCSFVTSLQDKAIAWGSGVEVPQKNT